MPDVSVSISATAAPAAARGRGGSANSQAPDAIWPIIPSMLNLLCSNINDLAFYRQIIM